MTIADLQNLASIYLPWLLAGLAGLVVWLILSGAKAVLLRKLASRPVDAGGHTALDIPRLVVQRTWQLTLFLISAYVAIQFVAIPDTVEYWTDLAFLIVIAIQIGAWLQTLIVESLQHKAQAQGRDLGGAGRLLGLAAKFAVWAAVSLFVLDNMGVNITALVAGLGVGGIAVGLAVQNILSDLFASLAIVLDKPFEIGDFVIFDQHLGTIETIGLKTTRIRSLSGEQIVCSNADLLSSRIKNYKRMMERRASFSVGVTYGTASSKLQDIPEIVKAAVGEHDDLRFERCHFAKYGAYSLDFETVYWVLNPDYLVYMDRQQAINLAIYKEFESRGIEFAYPTQTIFQPDLPQRTLPES